MIQKVLFEKVFNDYVKEHKSKAKAARAANRWYKDYRKPKNFIGNKNLVPGRIYNFKYVNPITKNLKWWDLNPLVFALKSDSRDYDIGINLNLVPIGVRRKFIEYFHNKNIAPSKITYRSIKSILTRYRCGFAVRKYYANNKEDLLQFEKQDWHKVYLLELLKLRGIHNGLLSQMYSDHLKRVNSDKKEIKRKNKLAKKEIKKQRLKTKANNKNINKS